MNHKGPMRHFSQSQLNVYFQNFKRTVTEEIDIDDLPMGEDFPKEDYDDLDEYSFSKFASMYFQGAATPTHIRQRLSQPLLYHEDEGDVLVILLYHLCLSFRVFYSSALVIS